MNTRKTMQVARMIVITGCVVAGVMAVKLHRQSLRAEARQKTAVEQPARQLSARLTTPAIPVIPLQAESNATMGQIESPKAGHEVAAQKEAIIKKSSVTPRHAAIRDPLAREALSLVGVDPDADAYWVAAINDPSLSADERQNLIEDLNEDGFSDPKHPGPEDLPLILNRIQLIEELAPFAMDKVNEDAFAEAYKDLANMVNGNAVQ